jgi:phosphatidylserine/phosphatidylglycerophosphate/cardiolipin synthase-like enzyme
MSPEPGTGNEPKNALALANNDVVYLWWSVPQKIANCLGFTVHRIVDGQEEPFGLPATVGFDAKNDKRKSPQTTDEWPVQSFNWKDLYAPHEKEIRYRIIPLVGTWDHLTPAPGYDIVTNPVRRTQAYGSIKVIFNRGLLSTQAFSKACGQKGLNKDTVESMIGDPDSTWRRRLAGQVLFNVDQFFERARQDRGRCYAALYELTDKKLIDELVKTPGTEIILSNANSSQRKTVGGKKTTITINDGTNQKTRILLHSKKNESRLKVYDRMLGTHIGHNKFVVYVDAADHPKAVLTGSTNWTPTGLCGQTNNMIIIEDGAVAAHYLAYWKQLKGDKNQDQPLRNWCSLHGKNFDLDGHGSRAKVWFSPNTSQKMKPKNPETPADMKDVFDLIRHAKKDILFLVFNPGSPSMIDEIIRTAQARSADNPLFVRGAISDVKIAERARTQIYSYSALKKPDDYVVSGVACIPGKFSYWEKELLKIGFATIHDKILVVDPLEEDCAVVTGSHNLGYTASFKNDENMVILRNRPEIAKAYAVHVLDIVNHFKWRYKLQERVKKAKAKTPAEVSKAIASAWKDLEEKDVWMDYYFGPDGFIDRSKMLIR